MDITKDKVVLFEYTMSGGWPNDLYLSSKYILEKGNMYLGKAKSTIKPLAFNLND